MEGAAVAAGAAALAVGGCLPLLRGVPESRAFGDSGLVALSVFTALAITLLLAAAAGLAARLAAARGAAIAVAAIWTFGLVTMLTVVCGAAAVVPPDVMPAILRRSSLSLTPGWGSAATLCGAGLAVIGASPAARTWLIVADARPATLVARVLLIVTAVTALALRQSPWLVVGTPLGENAISGSALPWVGPGSLLVASGVVAAAWMTFRPNDRLAVLTAAFGGWALSFLAALAITAGHALNALPVSGIVPETARGAMPFVRTGGGAWAAFFCGLAVAGCAASLSVLSPAFKEA